MAAVELRQLEDRDLVVKSFELSRELAESRLLLSVGQLENPAGMKGLRKERARVNTEIRRREIETGASKGSLVRQYAGIVREALASSVDNDGSDGEGGSKGLLGSLKERLSGATDTE